MRVAWWQESTRRSSLVNLGRSAPRSPQVRGCSASRQPERRPPRPRDQITTSKDAEESFPEALGIQGRLGTGKGPRKQQLSRTPRTRASSPRAESHSSWGKKKSHFFKISVTSSFFCHPVKEQGRKPGTSRRRTLVKQRCALFPGQPCATWAADGNDAGRRDSRTHDPQNRFKFLSRKTCSTRPPRLGAGTSPHTRPEEAQVRMKLGLLTATKSPSGPTEILSRACSRLPVQGLSPWGISKDFIVPRAMGLSLEGIVFKESSPLRILVIFRQNMNVVNKLSYCLK